MNTPIKWKRVPGGVAKISIVGGACMKSEDGRFVIYVTRYLQGERGRRSYVYHYAGIDYWIPSKGQRYTQIMYTQGGMRREYSSNKDTGIKAVETWAASHPKA